MTQAQQLAEKTLQSLIEWDSLEEIKTPGTDCFHPLVQAVSMAEIGKVRVFHGRKIKKMVNVALAIPPAGLDSHMIFAFTAPDSPIPHFTLDSVAAGPTLAYHLDLIPKVDLGADLVYLNTCYKPLIATYQEMDKMDGFTPAHLSPLQLAVMSPLMLAKRSTQEAFPKVAHAMEGYLAHWQGLFDLENMQPGSEEFAEYDFAKRDARNREILFSPEIDPVWGQIEAFIGAESGSLMRRVLKNIECEVL